MPAHYRTRRLQIQPVSIMPTPRIILLTGGRQVGKTTALSEAVKRLQDAGVKVAGLLTQRTGPHDLAVIELHTGARYSLTDPYRDIPGAPTSNFVMNEAAFARSDAALAMSRPSVRVGQDRPVGVAPRRGWVRAWICLGMNPMRWLLSSFGPSCWGMQLPSCLTRSIR